MKTKQDNPTDDVAKCCTWKMDLSLPLKESSGGASKAG